MNSLKFIAFSFNFLNLSGIKNSIIWFILNALFVSAADIVCESSTPCMCILDNGDKIDLSSIGSSENPRFFELALSNCSESNDRFSYNPCYPFNSILPDFTKVDGHYPCKGAAACRTKSSINGTYPEEYAIGIQNQAKFFKEGHDIFINYTVPNFKDTLTVELSCTEDKSPHLIIKNITDTSVTMVLSSKCACPNGCRSAQKESSHGLSTGSILLITFFTILLMYLVLGIIWNFCNGAQGAELLPNLEFWNDLPKLIIEGVIFTCSCFGRRNAYGQV